MSWSGTVTCSYCYHQGHNKRKCPELSAQIKSQYMGNVQAAAREREANNESGAQWYDQRAEEKRQEYIKRTKIDLATGDKVTNKAAKAARMKKVTCGYCGQRGHTRRVCDVVKHDKLVFIEQSRRARLAAFEHASNMGIGVGSMLPVRTQAWKGEEYCTYTQLRYIKGMDWDTCDKNRPHLYVYHIDACKLGSPSGQARNMSRDSLDNLRKAHHDARDHALSEEQPAPMASLIPTLDPPKGWLQPTEQSMKANLRREFPTTGNEYNKARNWQYRCPEGTTIEVIKHLGLQEYYDVS